MQTVQGEETQVAAPAVPKAQAPSGLTPLLCGTALASCWLMWVVPDVGFDRYHLPKELALSVSALLALALSLRSGLPTRLDLLDLLALVSLSASGTAALGAISPALSLRSMTLELAITVLFLSVRGHGGRARTTILTSLVVAACGVAVIALAEGFGLLAGLSRTGRTPGATLGQRNMVAHLLALASPLAWWLAATARGHRRRALGIAASACMAAALLWTRSRAGWLGFGAALVCFLTIVLVRTRPFRGDQPIAVMRPLAAVACGLSLALLAPSQLAWNSPTPYADSLAQIVDYTHGSGAGRLAQARTSLALVPHHPLLGVGPGNWMVSYPQVASARELDQHGHGFLHTGRLPNSDWLALLIERGALGTALALLFSLAVARAMRRSVCALPGIAMLAALAVVSALDAVLQVPATAGFAALALALCVPRDERARAFGPRAHIAGWALCLLLAWTSLRAGERLLGLWARTRPGGGYAAMEAAVRWNPADLTARFALAEAYALKGDCPSALPHLRVLRRLLPYHRAPRMLGCDDARRLPGDARP